MNSDVGMHYGMQRIVGTRSHLSNNIKDTIYHNHAKPLSENIILCREDINDI